MGLITVEEASSISKIPDSTIRDWIKNNEIEKYKDKKGLICIDKREFLELVPTVFTFYNYKGGVCKTSLSWTVADYYEKKYKEEKKKNKILLIDLDPQGNLSKTYFEKKDILDHLTLSDFFDTRKPLQKIIMNRSENVDILPAHIDMNTKVDNFNDFDLVELKNDFKPLFKKYSIVIIDSPPTWNSYTKLSLLLSNFIFIPIIPEPYSYDGIVTLLNLMTKTVKYNEDYSDYKILFTKIKGQKIVLHEDYMGSVLKQIPEKVIKKNFPESISIAERAKPDYRKYNFFDINSVEESLKDKINELCLEIDNIIYEERMS